MNSWCNNNRKFHALSTIGKGYSCSNKALNKTLEQNGKAGLAAKYNSLAIGNRFMLLCVYCLRKANDTTNEKEVFHT